MSEGMSSVLLETIGTIISGLTVIGIIALLAFGRRIVGLPKEMIVVKAALFRQLRSNKLQGVALAKIATAVKLGSANGECDDAIKAVKTDQQKTDEFLAKAALLHSGSITDLLKEEE